MAPDTTAIAAAATVAKVIDWSETYVLSMEPSYFLRLGSALISRGQV